MSDRTHARRISAPRRRVIFAALLALSLLGLTSESLAAINLIQNGDFEDPQIGGTFTTLSGTQLPEWTITSGSVDLIHTYWPPFTPTQSIDLAGSEPGVLTQSFATVPGQTYLLSFAYADNPDSSSQGPPDPRARVQVLGSALDFEVTHSTSTFDDMDWNYVSVPFTATGTSATLQFTSLAHGPWGIALDAVSVTAVPEPATMVSWGLIIGAVSVGAWWTKRKRSC